LAGLSESGYSAGISKNETCFVFGANTNHGLGDRNTTPRRSVLAGIPSHVVTGTGVGAVTVAWPDFNGEPRNPRSVNGVRERALLKESAHGILGLCCLHNQTKGTDHEQIQTLITHDLTLQLSHRVGAKVSVSGAAREGESGGGYVRAGTNAANEV